jgi:cytidine deaminase
MTGEEQLVAKARALAKEKYVPHRHAMFSALITKSGNIFLGAHVEGSNGRVTICAEGVAIGAAATAGDTDIRQIVAVTESGDVVPPCGMCRMLINDYGPDADVLMESNGEIERVPISILFPRQYRSEDYPNTRD